ncbi:MAG: hypothetical protein ACE5OS_02420 [Anaerolineae bacterium]
MSEEQKKNTRLLAFWLFGTVMIVFAAITAYIFLFTAGVFPMWAAIKVGFPIWGITALAAIIIYAGYYFYTKRKS